jgi:hypothetical protein
MNSKLCRTVALLTAALLVQGSALAADPQQQQEQRNLEELRNTVINLLQGLVEKGVLTHEQAEAMVKNAQEKAAASAAAAAASAAQQEKAEEGAVRVPYVPEIVKDEIRKEVVQELGPDVKKEVVDQVTSKGSLFSALPEWIQVMKFTGDIRVRGEGDDFANNNATNAYLDFNQVNAKGGVEAAGLVQGLLNTTKNQDRLRLRVRFGFDTTLGAGFTAGVRLATGSTGEIIATTNQTLGTYGAGYTTTIDQGYLRWTGQTSTGRQIFTLTGGRFENPFISTDLVWYNDLTFEGLTTAYRFNFSSDNEHRKDWFVTLGGFPLSSYSPLDPNAENQQKWLAGGQTGVDFRFQDESRIRFGGTYYDYIHIVGQRNPLDSTEFNWTAPAFVQKGNTLFNIAQSSTNQNAGLYALASQFRIVDLIATGDLQVSSHYSLGLTVEALKNIGFKSADVLARTGTYVAPRTRGYRADLGFGSSNTGPFGTWRATIGYRYLERDAVLDAFNDEDFHLGGTDAKGYTGIFDFFFNPHVYLRTKYMSSNAIDGPPLGIDVWQVDMNARF